MPGASIWQLVIGVLQENVTFFKENMQRHVVMDHIGVEKTQTSAAELAKEDGQIVTSSF